MTNPERCCERCGMPLNRRQKRYCSKKCCGISQRKNGQSQWGLRKLARKHRKAYCEYPGCEKTEYLHIHHIDNDRNNFSPDNLVTLCPKHHMGLHHKKEKLLTFQGKTQHIEDWARELGILRGTIEARLKYGWGVDKALTVPVRRMRNFSETSEGT